MLLQSLTLRVEEWGENKGKYSGTVSFLGESGVTQLNINAKISQAILSACAEALVESAKEVADNMTAETIDAIKGARCLEDKS